MNKVLVTGANGFIGRHLLKVLLNKNVEVFAIVRNKTDIEELGEKYDLVHWIEGDLFDGENELIQKLSKVGATEVDCMYYLAWSGVASSKKNDYKEQIKNIQIAKNVLTIAKKIRCKKIVNLGTSAAYVRIEGLISENSAPSPADIYGAVKLSVRYLLDVQAESDKIDIVNTILCSTFGEYRCDDNVISYTIKKLLKGESPEYGNLEQLWDFLYVDDAALALYLIGEKGVSGKTYGIGSGTYRYLSEYIDTIRNLINPNISLGVGKLGNRFDNILNSCIDTFQLQKDTGFIPRYTFVEGIQKTIEFFRGEMKL